MVSGQAPNPRRRPTARLLQRLRSPASAAPTARRSGSGCVYPSGGQDDRRPARGGGLTWKGYMEDMGTPCRHPALEHAATTPSRRAPDDQYAARHNPFVYFHSIIDDRRLRAQRRAAGRSSTATWPRGDHAELRLHHARPLPRRPRRAVRRRPPGRPCRRRPVPADLGAADPALARLRRRRLLVVTFDEAESGDATACCNEPHRAEHAQARRSSGPGGGRTGTARALALRHSRARPTTRPTTTTRCCAASRTSSGCRTWATPARPGCAAFGADVYNAPPPAATPPPHAKKKRRRVKHHHH